MPTIPTRAVLAALLLLTCLYAQSAEPVTGRAKVVDGDSLEIAGTRIRLWGIDAPEYGQTCERAGKSWKCGAAAIRALRARVAGRRVVCEPLEIDKYGRAVSRCTVDGKSLNEWLVREGWALDYRRYSHGAFADAQDSARAARRGIWSGEFETPEQLRHSKP